MKKILNVIVLLMVITIMSGCELFTKEEEKFVTFSYNDSVYNDYKCKIKEGKINCMILEPENGDLAFMGWYDENDNKVDIEGEFESSITLHPKFLTEGETQKEKLSAKKYTITFDMNGGSGSIDKVEVEYEGQLYKLKSLPKRSGYVFLGFYDSRETGKGKQYYNEKGESIRNFDKVNNTTLYARWSKEVKQEPTPITPSTPAEPSKEEKKYTITFNVNNGSGGQTSSVSVTNGSTMPSISKTAPTRKGYIFVGWYDNSDYIMGTQYYKADGSSARTYDKTSNMTLYAGWKKEEVKIAKYTVTFNVNGGNGGQSSAVMVGYGEPMPSINKTAPSRSNYTFMGWYDNTDWTKGTQYYKEDNLSARAYNKTSNITLYAGWEQKEQNTTYTVAFNLNSGNGTTPSSVKATNGSSMPSITSTLPSKVGYTFMGWYDNSDYTKGKQYYTDKNKSARSYDKKAATTLYAGWKANTFTVSYNSNGGSGSTASHTCTYDKDCKLSSNGFTRSGYIFTGWKKSNTGNVIAAGSSIKNVVTSGTITYYAQWSSATYTVSFNINNGSGTVPSSVTATYGSSMPSITSAFPSRTGYTFMGWYDNADYTKGTEYYTKDNKSARTYNKYAATTLYAGWKVNTYTVSFNLNSGNGTTPSSVSVAYGSPMPKITISTLKKEGYTFQGWYDNTDWTKGKKYYNADGTSARPYDKASNTTLYAGWKQNSKLEIYFLSLGRYDGYLIMGNDTTIFIDGGDPAPGHTAVQFLKSLGVKKIDALVGSHLHYNHIAAHEEIIDNFEVVATYYPDDPRTCKSRKTCRDKDVKPDKLIPKLANIPVNVLTPKLNTKIGNLDFDILAPFDLSSSTNYNSLHMILKYGDHKFYFTGDSGISIFNKVNSTYDQSVFSNISIFKHPHHGQEPVPAAFIKTMSPKYVIVPNKTKSTAGSAYKSVNSIVYELGEQLIKTKDADILSQEKNVKGYVLAESDGKTLVVTDRRK